MKLLRTLHVIVVRILQLPIRIVYGIVGLVQSIVWDAREVISFREYWQLVGGAYARAIEIDKRFIEDGTITFL